MQGSGMSARLNPMLTDTPSVEMAYPKSHPLLCFIAKGNLSVTTNGHSGLGIFWHHLWMPEREMWLDTLGNHAVICICAHICVCLADIRWCKYEKLCIIITENIVLMHC